MDTSVGAALGWNCGTGADGVCVDAVRTAGSIRRANSRAEAFIIFGLVSLVIGVQFLRMRPAARPALEILAWVVLGGTLLSEGATLTVWKQSDPNQAGHWISSPVTSLILSLLQVFACILIIRFVRSPAVRAAFRAGTPETRG